MCFSFCVKLFVCPSIFQLVRPTVCMCVCPSVFQSVCPTGCPSVYQSVRPTVCMCVCPSNCPYVCMSVCISVCQSVLQIYYYICTIVCNNVSFMFLFRWLGLHICIILESIFWCFYSVFSFGDGLKLCQEVVNLKIRGRERTPKRRNYFILIWIFLKTIFAKINTLPSLIPPRIHPSQSFLGWL